MDNKELTAAVLQLKQDHEQLKREIAVNTNLTQTIDKNTKELLEVFTTIRSLLIAANTFSRVLKWISIVVGSVAAIYFSLNQLWHSIHPGK